MECGDLWRDELGETVARTQSTGNIYKKVWGNRSWG